MTVLVRLLAVLALIAPAAPAFAPAAFAQAAAQTLTEHLFYEAVPGDVPSGTSYEVRRRLTEQARDELVPAILRAVGVDESRTTTELRMGGYRLRTSPSLHTMTPLTATGPDRLARALAWVFDQDSVLVADFGRGPGSTGYALVRFSGGAPTPDDAQRFFEAAAAVHPGLGGGYTAFDDALLFLNLRGEDGAPLSGLTDEDFIAALRRATEGSPGVTLTVTGRADAHLVERPSVTDNATDNPTLARLRERRAALTADALASQAPAQAPAPAPAKSPAEPEPAR